MWPPARGYPIKLLSFISRLGSVSPDVYVGAAGMRAHAA
jgi:hypothetical protein